MSDHTIDEKAFQEAASVADSWELGEEADNIIRKSAGTHDEKMQVLKRAKMRILLETYLEFVNLKD